MAPPTSFEKDESDRIALESELTLLEAVSASHAVTALTETACDGYLQKATTVQNDLSDNMKAMCHHAPRNTDMTPYTSEYTRMYTTASRLHAALHGIKMGFPAPATPPPPPPPIVPTGTTQQIKLPPLELPKFGGNRQEWVSFRDLYTTAIHKSTLTHAEKMTHLKSLLTGDALGRIRSLVISDANYDIAWNSLKKRYENERELFLSIMKRIDGQPIISSASYAALRHLIDTTMECVRQLEVLGQQTQHWGPIMYYFLLKKLDNASRELWEQSLTDTKIPDIDLLYDFLEQRARALESTNTQPSSSRNHQQRQQPQGHVRAHHADTARCPLGCSKKHALFLCEEFQKFSPQQRQKEVKRLNRCINCLSEGHLSAACRSKYSCKTCKRKHHSMLHFATAGGIQLEQQQGGAQNHHLYTNDSIRTGLLATALIKIHADMGGNMRRALLDNGSTNSFITERAAKAMKLPLRPVHIPVTGLQAASCGRVNHVTSFILSPHFESSYTITVTALVVNKISSTIPTEKLRRDDWYHLQGLPLADPEFHIPEPVDVLLGTEHFWSILENDKIRGEDGQPIAWKSSLGWLVAGPNNTSTPVSVFNTNVDLNFMLERFWTQETVSEEDNRSTEEKMCEEHFSKHHRRDSNGRFTISLPLKTQPTKLGDSLRQAKRRFLSLEHKFALKNTQDQQNCKLNSQWSEYQLFMKEYEDLGHMSLVPPEEVNNPSNPTYYIPHHCVVKDSSTTTKLRVVFDASATSTTGLSLNDCLMVGPPLQDHIADIMLRFRTHPIAFTADIAKMYRQIQINPQDADLQRIIWRSEPTQPIQHYRLLSVTYGTASAPYQAVKCLQQLAVDEQQRFPEGSRVALNDFYVDDTASGCSTLEQAKLVTQELQDLCMSGGFQLRKWTTNSQELLETIPQDLRETSSLVKIQHQDPTIKMLGVYWNPSTDKYIFKVILQPDMPDWDDHLADHIQIKWNSNKESLADLEKLEIPRCVMGPVVIRIILVGCSDASLKAISACVYICCFYSNSEPTCHLVTAKTKVAPLKLVTLPRLELGGAVVATDLLDSTIKSLKLPVDEVRAFTDSTIALHWTKSPATRWKPYIRRRVQHIQDKLPNANWYHIPGHINPADCASRGISAAELLNHPLWWKGTSYFFSPDSTADLLDEEISQLEMETKVKVHTVQPTHVHPLFLKFASFRKLQRVTAFILRFLNNWVRPKLNIPIQRGPLTVSEFNSSSNFIFRSLQHNCFPIEMSLLKENKPLPTGNRLASLAPFLCDLGILRVGGRLRHANLPFDQKHQILLPKSHHVTTSIIWDIHIRQFHSGPSSTLATFHQRFWVVNGRDTIRCVLRKCVICHRQRATMMQQVMGDLPFHRINPSRPFSKIGIDYAGPFLIRPIVRSKVTLKCWIALFVCFATRAIHIEVVSSLSTDGFLAALRRFTGRRGAPSDIYTDQGSNFKGAAKVLRDFLIITQQYDVQSELTSQGISWHFNPAGAPHLGGLWEAGVKSIKHHLSRVLGPSRLTFEEMTTLLTQIEGILNSRPLVPASSDPSDLGALTPAHFLIGTPITALPEPNIMDLQQNHLNRWQRLQQQQQPFWKRWSLEFITRLQQRPKWWTPAPNLSVGHLVIIKDERLPPLKWKLGRVTAVHPGKDGHVRVATLKTADGEIKRPIVKLSLLPIAV